MENVRMAIGSNSASMWWLNGEEAALLSGDRRMVMDDVVSKRLTLKKGKNVIRGAVINGPGIDRKSTRLNSSHVANSYAVFCLKKKNEHVNVTKDGKTKQLGGSAEKDGNRNFVGRDSDK